jgi:hypothetical protein
MKKILFITVFLMAVPAICLADFNISNWKYYKNIENTGGDLVKLNLDDEIFSGSKSGLSDVRIINQAEKEAPFKIVSGKQKEFSNSYPLSMINNSFVSGQFSMVILDLGSKGKITNNLKINTTSENFQRNVKIYGSDDMSNWNLLKGDAYIYDYTDKKASFKSQNTSVYFPESIFKYLKLEIADDNNSPIKIISVSAGQNIVEKNNDFERSLQFSISENSQNKATELVADLGSNGIPTSKIMIKTKENNFNRGIIISSSSDKNKWNLVGQGYVFRYTTPKFSGENMAVSFPETNNRYLKIEIVNKDNEPISVSGLSAFSVYREIIFQAKNGENYRIFYGNNKANYPQYDLEKYFQYLDMNSAKPVVLSKQNENNQYIPEKEPQKPLSERIPYLFSSVLVLVSLALLFLVYKFLKK